MPAGGRVYPKVGDREFSIVLQECAGKSSIDTSYPPLYLVECPTCLILTKQAANHVHEHLVSQPSLVNRVHPQLVLSPKIHLIPPSVATKVLLTPSPFSVPPSGEPQRARKKLVPTVVIYSTQKLQWESDRNKSSRSRKDETAQREVEGSKGRMEGALGYLNPKALR
jgi:hypothetical protein